MKIMIAVPCFDKVDTLFVESLLAMRKPEGTQACFHKNSLIYDARNLLSLRAIQEKYDYVLWVDSDIVCPPDALSILLEDMDTYETRMVTGLYVTRSFPPEPVLYDVVQTPAVGKDGKLVKRIHVYKDYPHDMTFDVDGCGFGFVLTRVDLLKDVWDRFGPAFAPLAWTGEDIAFCHRVRELGDNIMCDSRVRLGHIGNFVYSDALLKRGGDAGENS